MKIWRLIVISLLFPFLPVSGQETQLDELLYEVMLKIGDAGKANERGDHASATLLTYEAEVLLYQAMEKFEVIADELTTEEIQNYKDVFIVLDSMNQLLRAEADMIAIEKNLEKVEDLELLYEIELALSGMEESVQVYQETADRLEEVYKRNPDVAEMLGVTYERIQNIRETAYQIDDEIARFEGEYERLSKEIPEYKPPEQREIEAVPEVRERLIKLGIIPPELGSFFNQFDMDGDGSISLDEGEEFYYWVEENIKYRYDDEQDEDGMAYLIAGKITKEELGDGRPGADYPQTPYETFKEGYGDCEDMAILETAFYNYFGVEAYVGSVSVKVPGIIDHAIALVKIGDSLDEYKDYLGSLMYYSIDGKYFMLVDNAYSNHYGYLTRGLSKVDFTLIKYRTLEEEAEIASMHGGPWREIAEKISPPEPEFPTPAEPGFEVVLSLTLMMIAYLLRKNRIREKK